MTKLLLTTLIFVSVSASALPWPRPDVICVSKDLNWMLLINSELGMIRVVDKKQGKLSHKVAGLINSSTVNLVRLINPKNSNNGLPAGIVFRANMTSNKDNAYGVDDSTGRITIYSCKRD